MNLRQAITRKVTYSIVTATNEEGNSHQYIVYGLTTPVKETKRLLREMKLDKVPFVEVETKTEQRAMTIENFINYSILINESEEN